MKKKKNALGKVVRLSAKTVRLRNKKKRTTPKSRLLAVKKVRPVKKKITPKKKPTIKRTEKPKRITKKIAVKKGVVKKAVAKKIVNKKRVNKKVATKKSVVLKSTKSLPSKTPVKVMPKTEAKLLERGEPFLAQNLFKAKIKVIGIGGGGSSIVSEISRSLDKATFVIADTDTRVLGKQKGVKYFLFGQEETHGLGTGLNPELAMTAAEKEREKITQLFADQDIVIFIASLGGGVGSGATKMFAEASKDSGAITLGIFTLPFKFEGGQKHKIANKALRELKPLLNVSITIPNEKIFNIIDTDTPIVQAFSRVNKHLIEGLESLIDLIYNPGLINIDFADVKAILRGKGSEAFLNTVEASGKDRAEKIVTEILHNPLYQRHHFVPEKMLFNILGGNNVSMFEVDKISKAISQQNPKAKIIFGISKNNQLKNKIRATLLMTGGDSALVNKAPAKTPETEPKKVNPPSHKALVRQAKPIKKKEVVSTVVSQEVVQPVEAVFVSQSAEAVFRRVPVNEPDPVEKNKKTIRRNALEIKKAQDLEEKKKTIQEEEWEIPAFMRIKK